jgi:2-(1,2-epoxy-1,2-dihydrophenyl)acetyl-CoA isomerase
VGEYETLRWSSADGIARITLDRPDAANGLDPRLARELGAAAARCDDDPAVKAVVLTGSGRFFCAGGDLKAMAAAGPGTTGRFVKGLADDLHRAVATLARMAPPLVVAVNGTAAGAGLSLAAVGDLVVAAEGATFTMAYTRAGLSPDGSSTWFLPRVIGLRRTQELALTNRVLTAAEALGWGLVTRVVPAEDLAAEATALAASLAAGSRAAQASVRQLLLASSGHGLEEQMELEGRTIAACAAGPDGREGVGAFVGRRAPRFA